MEKKSAVKRGKTVDLQFNPQGVEGALATNFPVIDRIDRKNKEIISTKSIDPNCVSYTEGNKLINALNGYANKLGNFDNHYKWKLNEHGEKVFRWSNDVITRTEYNKKVLEVVLPDTILTNKALKVLEEFQKNMKTKGIEVRFGIAKEN